MESIWCRCARAECERRLPLVRCDHPPILVNNNKKLVKNFKKHFRSIFPLFQLLFLDNFFLGQVKKNLVKNFKNNLRSIFFGFFHFVTNFFLLTQQVKIVQSPVSSRQLKHLKQSSRRSRSTASHDSHSGCLLVMFEGARSCIRIAIDMMLLIE